MSISGDFVIFRKLALSFGLTVLSMPAFAVNETIVTERMDGSPINIYVERPDGESDIPIVLFIDGSGCQSANRKGFQEFSELPEQFARSSAKLFVDKPGVNPNGERSECTQTFLNYYTIDQRILDHLRAIQHLRSHASWWNHEVYVVGWSDGAMIGVSIAGFTPEVTRAVFLGLGGGIPMTRQFEEFILCAPDRTDTREQCVADLRKVYDDIRSNPSPKKTWFGDANSYKAWATRMDAVEFYQMKDLRIPFLIIHGSNDRDSVPVQSARESARMLNEIDGVDFEYWEVPNAGHNIGISAEGQSNLVRLAMFNWLYKLPPGDGGPPSFGNQDVE